MTTEGAGHGASHGTRTLTGHCLCGAIRFAFELPVRWVLHCHCESCRRATGSPMTTFVAVPDAQLGWEGTPARFASSPGVERAFCGTCGSPLCYRHDGRPDETHLYAALLDDPGAVTPEGHDFIVERIGWMHPVPDPQPEPAPRTDDPDDPDAPSPEPGPRSTTDAETAASLGDVHAPHGAPDQVRGADGNEKDIL